MSKLTLYVNASYTSPYAMSVYVALSELGLSFELETLDLDAGEQFRSPFRERSGTARIPTLRHDDFWLSESSAICEYLHDSFSATRVPLYPADVRQRARARQVQAWLRSDLAVLRQERPTDIVFRGETRGPISEAGRAAAEKLIAFAATLVDETGEPMFGQWCVADIELALMLNRMVMNHDPVPEHLAAYARREWQRPAVQAWCALVVGAASAAT